MNLRIILAMVCLSVLYPPDIKAQSVNVKSNMHSWSVLFDEDDLQFFGGTTDENYTMGLGIKMQYKFLCDNWIERQIISINNSIGNIFHRNNGYFPVAGNHLIGKNGTLMLAGNGFTPNVIKESEIQTDDRPYGSIVEVTYSISRLFYGTAINRKSPRLYTNEISLGILGTNVAKVVQTAIHQWLDFDIPLGWGNQISQGGEPTLLILNRAKYLVFSNYFTKPCKNVNKDTDISNPRRFLDLTLGREFFLGWYTGASASFGGRLGLLDFRNWSSNVNPLMNNIAVFAPPRDDNEVQRLVESYSKARKFEFYFSSEIKPMLIFYNAFLEGQFRKSVYTIPHEDIHPLIYIWSNALCMNIPIGRANLNIMYNCYSYKSPEFRRGDSFGRNHVWGGIYFTIASFMN
jgi:hypothetical protein